jgi:hypothetical protein
MSPFRVIVSSLTTTAFANIGLSVIADNAIFTALGSSAARTSILKIVL